MHVIHRALGVNLEYVFPDCEWQHIPFTMLDKLWEIFRHNHQLLGKLFNCTAQILIAWEKVKGLDIGIFYAFHTYSCRLNGISIFIFQWLEAGFALKQVIWNVIFSKPKKPNTAGGKQYGEIDLLTETYDHIREERVWRHFLDRRYWKVYFAQKIDNICRLSVILPATWNAHRWCRLDLAPL